MNGPLARGVGVALVGVLAGCGSGSGASSGRAADGGTVSVPCETDFTRLSAAKRVSLHDDVMPIFGLSCTMSSCHAGDTPAAELYLGVRCAYDAISPHHCTFPDTPDVAPPLPDVKPLTPEVVDRVYQGLLTASITAPDVQRVTPRDAGASFLIDKIRGIQDDRGYDCVSHGPAGNGGPCGSPMPFGSSLCDPGADGSMFNTIAAWVLQGARDD